MGSDAGGGTPGRERAAEEGKSGAEERGVRGVHVGLDGGAEGRGGGAPVGGESQRGGGRKFGLCGKDRVLQFTPVNFDAAVEEMFPPLAFGAGLVVRGELVPSLEFRDFLEKNGLTVLSLPPAYVHEWVTELERRGERIPRGLRLVLLGGEKLLPRRTRCGGSWEARMFRG